MINRFRQRASQPIPKGFFAIPILVASPFLFFGITEMYTAYHLAQTHNTTQGEVIDNRLQAYTEGGSAYTPVVKFRNKEGKPFYFTDGIGSYPAAYEKGDKVTVLYDTMEPSKARIKSWTRLWFTPTLFLVVGFLPIALAIIVYFRLHLRNDL